MRSSSAWVESSKPGIAKNLFLRKMHGSHKSARGSEGWIGFEVKVDVGGTCTSYNNILIYLSLHSINLSMYISPSIYQSFFLSTHATNVSFRTTHHFGGPRKTSYPSRTFQAPSYFLSFHGPPSPPSRFPRLPGTSSPPSHGSRSSPPWRSQTARRWGIKRPPSVGELGTA